LLKHKLSIIHPLLFSQVPILFLFTHNINILEISEIIFPSVLIMTVTISLFFVLKFIFKNEIKVGVLTSVIIIIFFSFGHIFNITSSYFLEILNSNSQLPLVIFFLLIFIITIIYLVKTRRQLNNATKILVAISFAMLSVSFVNIGTYYLQYDDIKTQNEINETGIFQQKFPNVFFIIVDGYAGSETLKEELDFDNTEFYQFLINNGFQVIPESHSNYSVSITSITSTLNMNYIHNLISSEQERPDNYHPFYYLLDNNAVMENFKSKGYHIVSFDSGDGISADISIADQNFCSSSLGNSQFMVMLTRTSILNTIHVMLFQEEQREKILCAFSELSNLQQKKDGPIFVFAHIMLPHPPYIFGPNGEEVQPKTLERGDNWEKVGYLDQTRFVNKNIKQFVNTALKNNSEQIIIIQSDHGSSFNLQSDEDWKNPTEKMINERMSNLNAIYLPENMNNVNSTITPVNTFRTIFNILGDDYEILGNQMYFNDYDNLYNIKNVTSILLKEN
jgi:hypothetical protein